MDRWTDGQTDGQTDRRTFALLRAAFAADKSKYFILYVSL